MFLVFHLPGAVCFRLMSKTTVLYCYSYVFTFILIYIYASFCYLLVCTNTKLVLTFIFLVLFLPAAVYNTWDDDETEHKETDECQGCQNISNQVVLCKTKKKS